MPRMRGVITGWGGVTVVRGGVKPQRREVSSLRWAINGMT